MCPVLCAAALAAAGAQTTLSPFLTLVPGSPPTMVGMSFSVAGGPFALRAGAHMSMQHQSALGAPGGVMRPWGADLDAIAYFERMNYGEHITFSPYVFAGVGTAAIDSGSLRVNSRGWSYGSGITLPLASSVGILGEWRWRMSRFVWPNATDAPSPTSEARVGIAFRIGGGGQVVDEPPGIPLGDDGIIPDGPLGAVAVAARVISTANKYVGTKYRSGGTSPSTGFDAAGFVRFVFARLGVILPRTSRNQARVGEELRADWHAIAPGDLVMFQDEGGINHVAIYVGQSRIVHSSETGGGVRYDDLTTERGRWFLDHMVAARRVTPDLRGLLLDLAREFTQEDASSDGPDRAPRVSRRSR